MSFWSLTQQIRGMTERRTQSQSLFFLNSDFSKNFLAVITFTLFLLKRKLSFARLLFSEFFSSSSRNESLECYPNILRYNVTFGVVLLIFFHFCSVVTCRNVGAGFLRKTTKYSHSVVLRVLNWHGFQDFHHDFS